MRARVGRLVGAGTLAVSLGVTSLGLAGCANGTAGSAAGASSAPAATATAATPTAATPTAAAPSPSLGPPTPSAASAAGITCGPEQFRPAGARLPADSRVVAAIVCQRGRAYSATAAEAARLAAALAMPTPPKQHVVCPLNIRADQPSWALRTSTGEVVRPAAPLDSCGRPIQAVQLAVAAIVAG